MTCLDVREALPDFALHVLEPEVRVAVEAHLASCDACRAEADDLAAGAAAIALAAPAVVPPPALGDRIFRALRGRDPSPAMRRRLAAISAVAAVLAVSGLGFGAAMAGRAERFEVRAAVAEERRLASLEQFRKVLEGVVPGRALPPSSTRLGQLSPPAGGVGGGAVLAFLSDERYDFAVVIVSGLGGPDDPVALPLRVTLRSGNGDRLRVGTIRELDGQGHAELFREFRRDLRAFDGVVVVDADGDVVLSGRITADAS
ncbi:MAG: zf-HC2 domain-containing protein [Actinomycetota bacterium]